MTTPDLINGGFEFFGAVCAWGNVAKLRKDRDVKGVTVWGMAFFWSWGLWNLYYYPHLGQWASFGAGCLLAAGNFAWLGMYLWIKYDLPRRPDTLRWDTREDT